MLPKLRLQTFWIVLLVLSFLWVAGVFGPFLYSLIAPTQDISAIVRALQGRESAPAKSGDIVQQVIAQAGPLGRAIQVGHLASASVVLQNGTSHAMTKVSDTFIAWFRKFPKPILLVVRRYTEDGALKRYEIDSSDSVGQLIRACVLPLAALAVSLYLVRKRKSPLLSDRTP